MITDPKELPEVRSEMAAYLEVDHTYDHATYQGLLGVEPPDQKTKAAHNEAIRLNMGELYFVNEDMTILAETAGESLPKFALQPEDLPSPAGLLVYERPIQWETLFNDSPVTAPITGMSWGPLVQAGGGHGIWLTFWIDLREADKSVGSPSGIPIPLVPHTEALLPFTAEPPPIVGITNEGKHFEEHMEWGAGHYDKAIATLVSTWQLMQQPITRKETVDADRHARKRITRAGGKVAPVRLVTLRHMAGTPKGGSREYRNKWIVRGHWRNQWYPGRKVHRPVWISPYVKGPENAPLKSGEKVNVWRR